MGELRVQGNVELGCDAARLPQCHIVVIYNNGSSGVARKSNFGPMPVFDIATVVVAEAQCRMVDAVDVDLAVASVSFDDMNLKIRPSVGSAGCPGGRGVGVVVHLMYQHRGFGRVSCIGRSSVRVL